MYQSLQHYTSQTLETNCKSHVAILVNGCIYNN